MNDLEDLKALEAMFDAAMAGHAYVVRVLQETGAIVGWCRVAPELVELQPALPGEHLVTEEHEPDRNASYYLDGVLTARPALDLPSTITLAGDGEDAYVSEPLPEGASVTVDGEPAVLAADRRLDLRSDMPGIYAVAVSCWPWRDHVIEVTVT